MRSARARRVQRVQRTSKIVEQPKVAEQSVTSRKEKRSVKRMEEEKPAVEEPRYEEDDLSDEESMIEEHKDLRSQVAGSTVTKMRPNQELYDAIRERYQYLLQELWKNESDVESFKLTGEQRNLLNARVKLWLEYFVSTATFRDENVNLFEYMDTFCNTEKFL